ncbi:phenylalanine--tRNA ligase subunit alpha [Candidatus Gottesmanbacteria bacterium]|nr:phenylalanine--tRNA ligase subunit alpha [Candidatus Gottesmanbacteria bacterium]
MQDKLIDIKNEALAQILGASDGKILEEIRVEYLGKSKGKITQILKQLPKMEALEKAAVGKLVNEVKKIIEENLASQELLLRTEKEKNIGETEKIDVTLPGIFPPEGHLHPLTQVLHQMLDIFKQLGYQTTENFEIENDWYNFTSLNMPKDAPSRDTQATFYLDTRNSKIEPGEILLHTQTSSMQVRVMEKIKPPLRIVVPGKCFRVDDVDPSHGFEFWQLEGLLVDKNIKMADLLGTMDYALHKLYGADIKIKFNATYFAFVEPGVQAFMSCTICKQKGCPFCKNTGWVEIMPAGMVHPNVIKNAGLNQKEWGGFSFALGLGRAAVLKYQIDDLRVLTNPDLRILKQF